MPRVKARREENMVVMPYHPWRKVMVILFMLCLLVSVGWGAHFLGFSRGLAINGEAQVERDLLRGENTWLQSQLTEVQQQLLSVEQEGRLDKQSLNAVQGTLLALRGRIAQLEEELLLYTNIMSPEIDERGLVIGQLGLVALEEDSDYRYRLTLKQQGGNQHLITGYANVNIHGHEDGVARSLPLQQLSETVDKEDIRLRFRYFQNIEGELRLPIGFAPKSIEVLAVSENDANAQTVQKHFDWIVEDKE